MNTTNVNVAVCIHFPSAKRMEDDIKSWLVSETVTLVDDPMEAQVVVTDDLDTILKDPCRDPSVRKYLFFGRDERAYQLPNVRQTTLFGRTQVHMVVFNLPYVRADINLLPI